ncbi:BTB/POZ domain-containing protein 9 [Eurytemora carolleeae]|uniref:BTB/POZ domain-containing protein 9 n=1 Tax=Eurytemora carolleeae TaxID=1294199 RepID=UPI000C759047|nr:BTB/POZ domain-containing protein 9 [Eurytemora carolleeae]|eukprot:XP_023340918.1 BTB/POZ domain-containing protein 9-like [Eurytemora affinis]
MDRHAVDILNHESFTSLSEFSVREIISRDSFCAEEVQIFRAVASWAKGNPEAEVSQVLKEIRLSLLSIQDLLKVVRPTDLIPPDVLLDAIQSRTESKDTELRYRGYKIPEENVALPRHGATVLVGEVKDALLNGDNKNYDMERGFSRHPIDEAGDKGIVVKLGMPCILNRINLLLWDRDQRAYSYYIEVSMDQKDWIRVVDHSKHHCRSWQYLYFPARVVRYFRIVGTHNTVNKVFHVVTLEALYTEQIQNLDLGLIIPQSNVATLDHSALVTEGVCRSRNALLNGDTSNYDWDSGYTCHQLGSGAIVVQLGQPYALDSMRLLLWDCDDRSYSYYIEVSTNQREWEVVCDRTREACRSWQLVTFKRRPVVFVRYGLVKENR